nr:immunoglobulin heavy chain junction region [Macaca mulatta]
CARKRYNSWENSLDVW